MSLLGFLPYSLVQNRYVDTGANFGIAVNMLYMGECDGFERRLNRWAFWEKEYANRGYRTISLDDFIELGTYGKSVEHLLWQKLDENEKPVFHTQIYREDYLGKVEPVIDIGKLLQGEQQAGFFTPPSTKSDL